MKYMKNTLRKNEKTIKISRNIRTVYDWHKMLKCGAMCDIITPILDASLHFLIHVGESAGVTEEDGQHRNLFIFCLKTPLRSRSSRLRIELCTEDENPED